MKEEKKFEAPRRGGPFGGGRHMGPVEKPKDFKAAIGSIVRYMGAYKYAVLLVMLLALTATVFNVVGPRVMGGATTVLSEGLGKKIAGTGSIDFAQIGSILMKTALIYLAGALFSFVQGFTMATITQKTAYRLRRDISEKINRMPMKYFEERSYGEVLSRITNDVDTLGMGLNQSVTQLITSTAMIVGVTVMMLRISLLMTLITMALLPLSVGLISLIVKKSQKYFKDQQEYLGRVNGQVEESYAGQKVIKAFNKEEESIKTFGQTNKVLYQSAWKSQFISGLMHPVMSFVGNLGYVGVAISGVYLAIGGSIKIGDIQAFIQYVRNFMQPIQQMAQVMNMLQSMAAAGERVFEFLGEDEEAVTSQKTIELDSLKGCVEFKNVRFAYKKDQTVIHDFSAFVKPGQKIAIVGPTGGGKTTLVKLLMRFYDVNSGAILLDGKDIRDYDRQSLRTAFGMVLQDTWLFNGSIMENIRYGRPQATDEEVIKAAKAAHAHHFIQAMPDAYNMVINEEAGNLSAGQKQLLTIARAILADSPILILDEATSSVDTATEQQIQKAMDSLMQGRTSFIIAHRLSTIKNADMILVLREGDIAEQGSHDELMEKDGFYADLYKSQFEMAV